MAKPEHAHGSTLWQMRRVGSDSIPRSGRGKPHPRGYGTFPRVIGQYAMREKLMSIEDSVRKSTSFTASRFGIYDRGIIKLGMKADLVLFSDEILDGATYDNPTEKSIGILGVWVNGVRIIGEDGELINDKILPGNVIIIGDNIEPSEGHRLLLRNSLLLTSYMLLTLALIALGF